MGDGRCGASRTHPGRDRGRRCHAFPSLAAADSGPDRPAGTPGQRSQQTSKGESPPQAAAPFTDADVMRITALPPGAQVEEVRKELKRRKPDFDGTLIPNLEAHEGAEARPPSRRYRLEKSASALPGTYFAARLRPPHLRAYRNPANLLRSHRPAYPRGGVLAPVCGHRVEDAGRFAHRLRRSLRGQSWAEKTLKNGRFLLELQKLGKPQDAKGTYFPSNLPSALPEWGSGALPTW